VTAFVRYTIRDLAMRVRDPSDLLHALNRAVLENETERFVTLVVVRLVDDGAGWSVTGSVGGHPLPLVRHVDGSVEELGSHGSLVGVISEPVFTTFEHRLVDDLVLMFTDGVIEARHDRTFFGAERLVPLVAAAAHDPAAVTSAVVAAVLDFQEGDAHDDIAVLTLGRDEKRSGAG
jgi:sigma-B regulation protein RsbU (phosphoserine phosphatase)